MRDVLPFLGMALRNFRDTASVIPSSRWAVRRVCNSVASNVRQVVVEYGPGMGTYPRGLLRKGVLTPDSKLILIEIDKKGADYLRKTIGNDERVRIYNDNAERASEILANEGEDAADIVLSGIPYSKFDEAKRERIVSKTANILRPSGKHIIYQFRRHVEKTLLQHFVDVEKDRVWFNLPPLHYFEAKEPRGHSNGNGTEK